MCPLMRVRCGIEVFCYVYIRLRAEALRKHIALSSEGGVLSRGFSPER
jgi:hypothetical protein